jgi:tetratricopeptide (TPR) repeat protein
MIMKLSSIFSFFKRHKNFYLPVNNTNIDFLYKTGTELIMPYIEYSDQPFMPYKRDKDILKKGIVFLDAVTQINPENDSAFWVKGKAYQAMKMDKEAYEEFNTSFNLNKTNPDIARELCRECLELGLAEEAVSVSKFASSLDPDDAGLMGNVALSYLIKGDLPAAKKIAKKALNLDPEDVINRNLLHYIDDINSGKRKLPKKLSEIRGY